MPSSTIEKSADQSDQPSAWLVRCCVALVAVWLALRCLAAWRFPVNFREAMVWERAQFPSLGYVGHPPMVAWLVAAAGAVVPTGSPLGLRAWSLVLGAASLWVLYRLALKLFEHRAVAVLSVVLASSLPVFSCLGVLMLPEAPLLFFYLVFLWLFVSAIRTGGNVRWCLAGLVLGLALLSHVTVLPAMFGCGAFLLASRDHRHWLRRPQPYVAALLALLVFAPFVWWDASHGWPTLKWYLWHLPGLGWGFHPRKILEYAGEQVVNAGPFLLLPIVGALFVPVRRLPEAWREPYRLLRWQVAPVLVFFLLLCPFAETHPNWTLPAYPAGVFALAALAASLRRHPLVKPLKVLTALTVAAGIALAVWLIAYVPLLRDLPEYPSRATLTRRVAALDHGAFGVRQLHEQLKPLLRREAEGGCTLLLADEPKLTALLSFHRQGEPVVCVESWLAAPIRPGDGQLFFLPWRSLAGRDGIVVAPLVSDFDLPGQLSRSFETGEQLEPVDLRIDGRVVAQYRIYRVRRFRPP